MRILVIGPASLPGSLVGSYIRAFEKIIGSNVIVFDIESEALSSKIKGDNLVDRIKRRMQYHLINSLLRKRLLNSLEKGIYKDLDLIFDFKSYWLKPQDLFRLKDLTGALVFHFNADSPFDKDKSNYHPNLTKAIPFYDCYFIWHKELIPRIYNSGAKRVEYLHFAWDPDLHSPINPLYIDEEKYRSDVVFVGNWTPERERWLSYVADTDLRIWGAHLWERAKERAVKEKWTRHIPIGEEFVKIVRASKISLNFLRDQNKSSHNMRTFEVPGCEGFLLTERSEEQLKFFEEDKEIACFSTPKELREKIEFYLSRDKLRTKMAKAAHQTVEEKHTYLERAKHILKVYGEISGRKVWEYLD